MEKQQKYETEDLPFILLVKTDDKLASSYVSKVVNEFSNAFASYTGNTTQRSIVAQPSVSSPIKIKDRTHGDCYQMSVDVIMLKPDFDATVNKVSPEGKNDFEAAYGVLKTAAEQAMHSILDVPSTNEKPMISLNYSSALRAKLLEKHSQQS